jgi:hypothetical protein
MSSVILTGDTSGTLTVSAPLVAGSNTVTLPAATGTISLLTQATAVTASGTSVDFTGIPSWAKRITVMFSGVSSNGTSIKQIQLGTSGGIQSTSYSGGIGVLSLNSVAGTSVTTGMGIYSNAAADIFSGVATIVNVSANIWALSFSGGGSTGNFSFISGSSVSLSGTLDRVRITTVNGTDTFDAGSINVMWEG